MSSIYTYINYQQILLQVHSILVNLRDSLCYMRQIAMHVMDYIRCSHYWYIITTCTSSRRFKRNADAHWKQSYHQPCTYQCHQMTLFTSIDTCAPTVLVAEEHFLLLVDVPIQDHTQQLEIYQVFSLLIP